MIKKITEAEFQAEAMQDAVAVVDFSATWCGPCKMLAPVLEEVSEEMPQVKFYNVDVDQSQALAIQYGIMSVPTVLLLKNGETVGRMVGFQPKAPLMAGIKNQLGL